MFDELPPDYVSSDEVHSDGSLSDSSVEERDESRSKSGYLSRKNVRGLAGIGRSQKRFFRCDPRLGLQMWKNVADVAVTPCEAIFKWPDFKNLFRHPKHPARFSFVMDEETGQGQQNLEAPSADECYEWVVCLAACLGFRLEDVLLLPAADCKAKPGSGSIVPSSPSPPSSSTVGSPPAAAAAQPKTDPAAPNQQQHRIQASARSQETAAEAAVVASEPEPCPDSVLAAEPPMQVRRMLSPEERAQRRQRRKERQERRARVREQASAAADQATQAVAHAEATTAMYRERLETFQRTQSQLKMLQRHLEQAGAFDDEVADLRRRQEEHRRQLLALTGSMTPWAGTPMLGVAEDFGLQSLLEHLSGGPGHS